MATASKANNKTSATSKARAGAKRASAARPTARAFKKGYDGLQILWDSQELEFIPARVLQLRGAPAKTWTAVHYRGSHSPYPPSYQYPALAKAGVDEVRLTYTEPPPAWPPECHGDIIPGTTVIALRDGRPASVTWLPDHDRDYLLVEGRDWAYVPPATGPVKKVRGKLPAMVTQRDGQQDLLKAMLLADHGGCQLTATRAPQVLEVCHIVEVQDDGDDECANALLLRRDVHRLFDRRLLRFELTGQGWRVRVDASVEDEIYRKLEELLLSDFDKHAPYLALRADLEKLAAKRKA